MNEIDQLIRKAMKLDQQGKCSEADLVDRKIAKLVRNHLIRMAAELPPLPSAAWQGTQSPQQPNQAGPPQQSSVASYKQEPDGQGGIYISDQNGKRYYHIPANQVAQQQAYIQKVTGSPAQVGATQTAQ